MAENTNPAPGAFNVEVTEGYVIENGVLGAPATGLTLSGSSIEMLMNVDRVGRVLPLPYHDGSFCGAASGIIPVTSYNPRVRVSAMNVGGKLK